MEIEQIQKFKKDFMDIYATLSDIEIKASQSKYITAIMNVIETDVQQLNLILENELTKATTTSNKVGDN